MGRAKVLKELGIVACRNAISGVLKEDEERIIKAEKAILQLTKEARQKRKAQKRKKEDKETGDTSCYDPGSF